jgi:SAM-dependent methyltransferase
MGKIIEVLDRTFYPGTRRNWDDLRFAEGLRHLITDRSVVLELGAGRGKTDVFNFKGKAHKVIGLDIDAEVASNPYLDSAAVISPSGPFPLNDCSVDIAFACNVMEHIQHPKNTLAEIARVLKPGGIFLAKTTNKQHYVALASRLTPLSFHKRFNRLRGREEHDTFPTCYRCNSFADIRRISMSTGLEVIRIECWEWRPEYLRFNPIAYVVGIGYERLVNSSGFLEPFRAVLSFSLRKPDSQ